LWLSIALVLLLGLLVGFAAGRALAAPPRPAPARTYVVRTGDTLWGIAERLAGPRGDPRRAVDHLLSINHLSNPAVYAGQRLTLPA
jgi:LysM repeat protein